MTRIAMIWGVTGQIGSYLAEEMLEHGYIVIGVKRRTSLISTNRVDHLYNNPRFKLEYGNLQDSSSIYSLLGKYKPDILQNCAAQSHVRVSFEVSEETFDVTATGVLRLLNATKQVSPWTKVFQCSSSEMFGRNQEIPQSETSPMIPASPYAVAKHAAHELCRNYRDGHRMDISCGILFNTESPRRGETFVTKKISMAAARIKLGLQKKVSLGNLDASRDWTHARDTARGIRLISEHSDPGDFVLASGKTRTIRDYLHATFQVAEIPGDPESYVEFDPRLLRPEEVPVLCGDATKAKTVLGWEPTIKFEELCREIYLSDLAALQR